MPEFPQLGNGQEKTQTQAVWSQSSTSYPQQMRVPWDGQTQHLLRFVSGSCYHCLLQLTSNCLRAFLDPWSSLCLEANSPWSRSSSPPKADGSCLWWMTPRCVLLHLPEHSHGFIYKQESPASCPISHPHSLIGASWGYLPGKLLPLESLPRGLLSNHQIQAVPSQNFSGHPAPLGHITHFSPF